MAGHYRVAAPDAQVGQPEVKLGIIPGAAGTQRLPRLAGVKKAVEMCAAGNPIKAEEALESGIIDRIIEGDLLTGAIHFAREIAGKPPLRRERTEKLGAAEQNAAIFAAAREAARKKQRGMIAPLAAVDAVEAATKLPFEQGCQMERKLFFECLCSDQSKEGGDATAVAEVDLDLTRTVAAHVPDRADRVVERQVAHRHARLYQAQQRPRRNPP